VNWKLYGLTQPKGSLPQGPYIVAVSVVSPFIKFKNASKETVDASDELVEEIRRSLQQCGQRLSAHIHREDREADMERKIQHIQQFAPILVDGLCRITSAKDSRKKKATEGLQRILGRDAKEAQKEFQEAHERAHTETKKLAETIGVDHEELADMMTAEKNGHREPKKKGQMELIEE
jgi:DNA topoisomerase-6 subunit B